MLMILLSSKFNNKNQKMNNQQKQQVIEQIKSANNVLVAVSSNPTVDGLAASVGLTLALNKLGKHATTVFSGVVPSTIEFLQPEKTIETTTDSLRDFIIALDKSKADKLRYKVEDDVVRIFITPYKTSISEKDLEFSQGDFNVDVVVALGVTRQDDLDKAITAHGRILHDATVVSVMNSELASELGSLNWQEPSASSLCEMVSQIVGELLPESVDGQMATALLTGIIAETDRFKNQRTTPLALSLSSSLMAAGANQQLIAEKLDAPEPAPSIQMPENPNAQKSPDGTLEIPHDNGEIDNIHIDDHGNLGLSTEGEQTIPEIPAEPISEVVENQNSQSGFLSEPPAEDTTDSAEGSVNSSEEGESDIEVPVLPQPDSSSTPMMEHSKVINPILPDGEVQKTDKPFDLQEAMKEISASIGEVGKATEVEAPAVETPETSVSEPSNEVVPETEVSVEEQKEETEAPEPPKITGGDTLADLEQSIGSPHATNPVVETLAAPESETPLTVEPVSLEPPKIDTDNIAKDPNAPPPVPPPMTPQFYDSDGNNSNPFLNPHP